MSPRPDVTEERQSQIIEAATRVFTERGFNSARMDDIVAESGLSKGTLYWYFESKEDIIVSILDRIFDWETAHLRETIAGEKTARQKLAVVVDTSIDDMKKIQPLMPIFFEFWSLSVRNQTIHSAMKRYYQQFLDVIEPIIQEGVDQGEFRRVPVRETAISIGALFEGTILMWAYFSEHIDFERQFQNNLDLMLSGLIKT